LKLTNKPDDVSLKLTEVVSTPASAKESILKKEEEVPPTTPDPPTPLSAAEEKPEKTVTDPEPTKVWTPLSKNFGAVCTLYEKNIGILSPILAQELDELATTYELDWIEAAIKEACAMQKRHLKYIAAILERWGTEGYKAPMGKSFKGIPGRPPTRNLPTADELEKAWKGRKEV
jgi:DnaD/phage-associated family protein